MAMFRDFEEPVVQYEGENDVGYVRIWMKKHSVPTIVRFGKEIAKVIFDQRNDIVIFFDKTNLTNKEEIKQGVHYRQAFADVATEMKG
jgi:hypothetical protein